MKFDRKQVKFSDWFFYFSGLPAKQILPDTAAEKSFVPEAKSKLFFRIWKTLKVSWFHHFFTFFFVRMFVLRQPKKLENYVVWRRKINNLQKWIKEVEKESKMLKTFTLNHDSSATWFRSAATFQFISCFLCRDRRYLYCSAQHHVPVIFFTLNGSRRQWSRSHRRCAIVTSQINREILSGIWMHAFHVFLCCDLFSSSYPSKCQLIQHMEQLCLVLPKHFRNKRFRRWLGIVGARISIARQLKFQNVTWTRRRRHENSQNQNRRIRMGDMKRLLIYCPLKHRNMISKINFFQNGALVAQAVAVNGLIQCYTGIRLGVQKRSLHSERASTDKYFPNCTFGFIVP